MQQGEYISVADIALRIGCAPVSIWRAIQRGDLPAASLRHGRKLWVPRDAAEQYITEARTRGEQEAQARRDAQKKQMTFDDF